MARVRNNGAIMREELAGSARNYGAIPGEESARSARNHGVILREESAGSAKKWSYWSYCKRRVGWKC